MPVSSAAQIHLYVTLFLAFWRIDWIWKMVTGAVSVVLAVYYIPWPFAASHGTLWIDALFALTCALISSALIPAPDEKKTPCNLCYFFCLVAIPAAVLGYASVYIPQTNFPLGIYLAAMAAAGLCTVQAIACPSSLSYAVLLPGSAFFWGMIAPDVRFLPVSLAFGLSVASFAFREESMRKHRSSKKKQNHIGDRWEAYATSNTDEFSSDTTDDDSNEDGKIETLKQDEARVYRRHNRRGAIKPSNNTGTDLQLQLMFN